jgi:hypothetical protein
MYYIFEVQNANVMTQSEKRINTLEKENQRLNNRNKRVLKELDSAHELNENLFKALGDSQETYRCYKEMTEDEIGKANLLSVELTEVMKEKETLKYYRNVFIVTSILSLALCLFISQVK